MFDDIIDYLDVAAKSYPIKHLAPKIKSHVSANVAESTLRNELNQQAGYKLGLITALQIIYYTGRLDALDAIEETFGRVAFRLPEHIDGDPKPIMLLLSKVSKDFGETIGTIAESMADGKITYLESKACLTSLSEMIKKCVELEANIKKAVKEPKNGNSDVRKN